MASHWIILGIIVLLIFGTSKLRTIGSDLGAAVKGFKKSMDDTESTERRRLTSTSNPADIHSDSHNTENGPQ